MPANGTAHANGQSLVGAPRTKGATAPMIASVPLWDALAGGMMGQGLFNLTQVSAMRVHSHVRLCLRYLKSPLRNAQFSFAADSPAVTEFCKEMTKRFWRTSLPVAQFSYDFGHAVGEAMYKKTADGIEFTRLKALHPQICQAYSVDECVSYVQVTGVKDAKSSVARLETANTEILQDGRVQTLPDPRPAKGWWITHDSEFSPLHGRSVLNAAWLPWRIMTMPEGQGETLFKAAYRHGLGCLVG